MGNLLSALPSSGERRDPMSKKESRINAVLKLRYFENI